MGSPVVRSALPVTEELRRSLCSGTEPTFIAIAHWLASEIRRGRLLPGSLLPSTRRLGSELGVNRNTVVAAYGELTAEGWVETRPASGTFVSAALPVLEPRRHGALVPAPREHPGFELEVSARVFPPEQPANVRYALWGGVPDLRLLPRAALARAYRRALLRGGDGLLSYDEPAGLFALRERLAAFVRESRGIAAGPEQVLVTRGSQMALDLLARTLLGPGQLVAVEEPGYPPAWAAFARSGAELVRVPVDSEGIDIGKLAELCQRRTLRALYVTPHHQYPTMATLSVARRLALLELARRERFAVIEDDYDHEFHYEGRPLLPLASADAAGVVVYVGTLAKVLAPGLRLGFVVAPSRLVAELARLRLDVDRQGDHVLEAAVAELIEDGELARHTRRMRRTYLARRDAFVAALDKHCKGLLSYRVPPGGMALWVRSERASAVHWLRLAIERGVHFLAGPSFAGPEARSAFERFARLGYARYGERELEDAVKRLARAHPGR
jgi:GntR family transcriptional regulator / MocR family aminotransferase